MESNHTGQFIFIEARGLTREGEPRSTYDNGEYLCLRDSGTVLYCCKPDGGYESHKFFVFHKIGSERYEVINVRVDRDEIEALAEGLEQFSRPAGKPEWNASVYAGAVTRAREMRKLLGQRQTAERVSIDIPEVVVNGVRYVPA